MKTSGESSKKRSPKIYHDIARFKGNTFEQNINNVNKLYLGLGLKISDVPYIYLDDTDNNIYLSAIKFSLNYKGKEHQINYPASFIYKVFYYDGILFYLQDNNLLRVYKFDFDNLSIQYYLTQQKKKEDNINEATESDNKDKKDFIPLKIGKDEVSKILNMLKNITK